MFFLISFALAKNYCVGSSYEKCQEIGEKYQVSFENNHYQIPNEESMAPTTDDELHNIYITENVNYKETKHNLIFCDPSIRLIYLVIQKTIKVNKNVIVNGNIVRQDIPLLFQFSFDITIEFETDETTNLSTFYLEGISDQNSIKTVFYTEHVPQNLFEIVDASREINVNEITDKIKTIFKNADKLVEIPKTYYCISDKENKCQDYSSYDLTYINFATEATKFPCVIIDESPIPQFLGEVYIYFKYIHIIALPGSHFTFYPRQYQSYFIMHSNSTEMDFALLDGDGDFTVISDDIKLYSATKTGNIHLTLKCSSPLDYSASQIHSLRPDSEVNLVNKINVPELCIFHGDKQLSGLFEQNKFIADDDILQNNLTTDNFAENVYKNFDYYFKEGDHEIPTTWAKESIFHGNNNTNFIFNDVHHFERNIIDKFITISSYKRIIIKPSKQFYLRQFSSSNDDYFTIQVENDIYMNGKPYDDPFHDPDEINYDKERCKITGNGKIVFSSEKFMDDVKYFCNIDNTVSIEYNEKYDPSVYVCIGQSDLDTCKSQISNIDSLENIDWIWLRNIRTCFHDNYKNYKGIFITDNQEFLDYHSYPSFNYYWSNVVITSNGHLTISFKEISINKNGIDHITAQSKTSKLTILFTDYYYYIHKMPIKMNYIEPPTDINLQFYFFYEIILLKTHYYENYAQNSIKLKGRCAIFIREPLLSMLDIFEYPKTIGFPINYDNDFGQICYADNPNQCTGYDDFIMPKNYEEFVKYESISPKCDIYLKKNITLDISSNLYKHAYFNCGNNASITLELSNDALVIFYSSIIEVIINKTYCHIFNLYNANTHMIFDVKDVTTLDFSKEYLGPKSFELISSKSTIEIIPSPYIQNMEHIYASKDLTITSPVPQYFKGLLDSNTVIQSTAWSYLYLSEKGKSLYDNYPSKSLSDFENDDDLLENIVLAVGQDECITIQQSWSKSHNLYILQDNDIVNNWIDKPFEITYLIDGIVLDNKTKIISGDLIIDAPNSFVVNCYLYNDNAINKLMYHTSLNCSNSDTYIYPGTVIIMNDITFNLSPFFVIYDYLSPSNMLYIKLRNSDEASNIQKILSAWPVEYIKYSFMYDYICYYPSDSISSKCTGNHFDASDTTSLLAAVRENPEKPILVGQDVLIPYTTQHHFILKVNEESINIKLPDAPSSMLISENNKIQVNYSDTTMIDIINKSSIDVSLLDSFKLNIDADTESLITFSLESNVILSTDSNYNANFRISVNENQHKLYSENADKFGNIFGDSLIPFTRICAYDNDADLFCTAPLRKPIDEVFTSPFLYNEVELALSTNPTTIDISSISTDVNVNILPDSSATLNVKSAKDAQFLKDNVITNYYCNFFGNLKVLNIQLNENSSISISDQLSAPITLQLMNDHTYINLKSCVEQINDHVIKILNNDNKSTKEITVYGSQENYMNFIKSIVYDETISINLNGAQKYLCLCNNDLEFEQCQKDLDGNFDQTNNVISDPGENVEIRVFSDFEVSSTIFTNENNVYIDPINHLNLTNIYNINQNVEEGLKVDNLLFKNISNLLLKPKGPEINVTLKKGKVGPNISIEIDSYLKINAPNVNEVGVSASRLHFHGHGEVNSFDYPFNRIRANSNIKVIKGVYIICNSRAGNNVCSYHSDQGYRTLQMYDGFYENLDPNSKIVVFLNSFTNNLDVNIRYLNGQMISFYKEYVSSKLLEDKVKLRIFPATELTSKSDSTTELKSSSGGALFDSSDSDSLIVGFNDTLTIKQEGEINEVGKIITLQPMSENVTIVVDDSVDFNKQKVQIETEGEKTVAVTVLTNKDMPNKDIINDFIKVDPEKVKVIVGDEENKRNETPTPKPKNKSIPKGAIAGIVIGVIVVVAVVIVVIIVIIRKKNQKENSNDEVDDVIPVI